LHNCEFQNRIDPSIYKHVIFYLCLYTSVRLDYLHNTFLEEQWKIIIRQCDQYYPIFKEWAFFTPAVIIRHPDDLKVINMKRN